MSKGEYENKLAEAQEQVAQEFWGCEWLKIPDSCWEFHGREIATKLAEKYHELKTNKRK